MCLHCNVTLDFYVMISNVLKCLPAEETLPAWHGWVQWSHLSGWRRKPHDCSPLKSGTKMHVQTCYTDSQIMWKGNLVIYHSSLRFALGALTRQAPPCESLGYKGIEKKYILIGEPLLEQHLKASNCYLYSLECIA